MNIDIKGISCNINLSIRGESLSAYFVMDDAGNGMWLPKNAFDGNGRLTEYGQRLYQEKT